MLTFAKRVGTAGLVLYGLFAFAAPAANAQRRLRPGFGPIGQPGLFRQFGVPNVGMPIIRPSGVPFASAQSMFPAFTPTMLQQNALANWSYNTAVIGQTYGSIPPWVFGWNPYVPQYLATGSYGGYGGYGPYNYGGGGYSNPYASAYYGGNGGGSYGSYGGYNPYNSPGYYGGGGYLSGSATLLSSLGQYGLQEEQARLLREQVEQAKLDTRKKKFDLAEYIRKNRPTWTDLQTAIQRKSFQRVQTMASPPEIWSGKSLNILLTGLKKYANQKLPLGADSLDEETLKHLNVTAKYGNLGLLRNNGAINWPAALRNPTLISKEERTAAERQTAQVFRQATNATIETGTLANLQAKIDEIRDKLTKSVNDIPTQQYMEAKRFLNDFDDALRALREGDAAPYFEFQTKFASGGKTAEELVKYMARNGLRFAPATSGDEAAYQAAHDALANWSLALENQVASAAPGSKE